MWLYVMFDLPVGTKAERKAATQFRKFLLDEGFEMAQFSVYLRFAVSKNRPKRTLLVFGRVCRRAAKST